ncbi:DinB family protein [Actinacidiphila acididurans]|uniref:DUF664 domain-containing protein n=1 Tax=Actinacidiphila acididurans TaxID=2784346 RepID=A0ABS2TYE8_9ACTN|nr:DinB family protein [Actinacidiphila acididurans]MBM9508367.1 DUF664 domain-containing protein [Actinacidiphila acididurans]
MDAEIAALLACLDGQRRHVTEILAGLEEEALRRAVLPSGWSCLGMVRHLTLDVERFWFRAVAAGEATVIEGLTSGDEAWRVGPQEPAETVLAAYREEAALCDAVVAGRRAQDAPAWWPPDLFADSRLGTLREILLHVIAETATHAGHLDAARELIDGRQWLVLTD